MECSFEKLNQLLDNDLNFHEALQVKEHMLTCAQCKADFDFLTNYKRAASNIESFEVPEHFHATVLGKIMPRKPHFRAWGGIAAALLVLVAGLFFLNRPENQSEYGNIISAPQEYAVYEAPAAPAGEAPAAPAPAEAAPEPAALPAPEDNNETAAGTGDISPKTTLTDGAAEETQPILAIPLSVEQVVQIEKELQRELSLDTEILADEELISVLCKYYEYTIAVGQRITLYIQ